MLLYLAQYLSHYIKSFRVFEYVTFRALCACLFALISSIYYGNNIINWLTKLKIGQSVRDDGPKTHMVKVGTPTMGGVLIILSVTFTTLLFVDLSNLYVYLVLFVLIATGLIGFIDDYKKIVYKNSKGISARAKLFFQSMIAIFASIVLIIISYKHMGLNSNISILQNGSIKHIVIMHSALNVVVPFIKNSILPLSIISFLILSYLVIVGSSNAVNLTDGLDGLVSFPVMTVTIGLAIFAYIAGHKIFSGYLLLPYISGSQELVVFCGALIGACLGFLWFNAYPALVFMGDVGALAIGAALGTIAIIVQQELTFAIMGGIFVLEAISVMLQVGSYKLRKKRVFLMAPIHHHFELKGWKENQVVVRFWIISIILLLLGLSSIKLR